TGRGAAGRPALGQDAAEVAGRPGHRPGDERLALRRARVGARLEELDADAPAPRPARLGSPGGHGTPLSDVRGNLAGGTLVLISRTGGGIPDDDELTRIAAGRELEVLLAVAPWRPSVHTRGNRAVLVFPTATPWGDVIAGCAEAATSERIVFAELPAVRSLARVPELLDELDDADVAGARLLRHDGVTLESAGGGFSSLRYAFALESGT